MSKYLVICPSCECTINLEGDLPDVIQCNSCGKRLKLLKPEKKPAFTAKAKQTAGAAVEKIKSFPDEHPVASKALFVAGFISATLWLGYSEYEKLKTNPSLSPNNDSDLENAESSTCDHVDCNSEPTVPSAEEVNVSSRAQRTEPPKYEMTDEDLNMLERLNAHEFDGRVGDCYENNYGSTFWFEIKEGVPSQFKLGPGGKFFNGKENEYYAGKLSTNRCFETDTSKLEFMQKYGWLSDDPDLQAYSAKFKGKV